MPSAAHYNQLAPLSSVALIEHLHSTTGWLHNECTLPWRLGALAHVVSLHELPKRLGVQWAPTKRTVSMVLVPVQIAPAGMGVTRVPCLPSLPPPNFPEPPSAVRAHQQCWRAGRSAGLVAVLLNEPSALCTARCTIVGYTNKKTCIVPLGGSTTSAHYRGGLVLSHTASLQLLVGLADLRPTRTVCTSLVPAPIAQRGVDVRHARYLWSLHGASSPSLSEPAMACTGLRRHCSSSSASPVR